MDSKKGSKIRDIVRLQQVLKKWRKQAACNSDDHKQDTIPKESKRSRNTNGMKFLKKTLSFSDTRASQPNVSDQDHQVPKGCLAVCVGREEEEKKKRFVIPMHYLRHGLFVMLLREAEEEFGFQNEGVLRIPCTVDVFEKVLRMMEGETGKDSFGSCSQMSLDTELFYDQHYCY